MRKIIALIAGLTIVGAAVTAFAQSSPTTAPTSTTSTTDPNSVAARMERVLDWQETGHRHGFAVKVSIPNDLLTLDQKRAIYLVSRNATNCGARDVLHRLETDVYMQIESVAFLNDFRNVTTWQAQFEKVGIPAEIVPAQLPEYYQEWDPIARDYKDCP